MSTHVVSPPPHAQQSVAAVNIEPLETSAEPSHFTIEESSGLAAYYAQELPLPSLFVVRSTQVALG